MPEKKATGINPLEGKQALQGIENTTLGYVEGQVGIPGVNVNVKGGSNYGNSPANPTGEIFSSEIPGIGNVATTVDGAPSSSEVITNTTNGVNTGLSDAINEGIAENDKLANTIDTNYDSSKIDIATDKTTDIDASTKYYKENEKLVKDADEELKKIQEDQLEIAEERKGRDVALLEGKKQSDIDMLEASNALQRTKNEQALKEARTNIEIERQKSAWAYNKIGLGFSSGIINQSQNIATQGIAKIAEIKAQMAFNEASIDAQIAGLEFDYSSLVNETIDKYSDRTNDIKESMRARINDTKKSLLMNSFDKNKELTTIEREARDNLKKAERQHIEDIIKVKDRGIEMHQILQNEITRYKNEELTKMDTMLSNGTFAKLTPDQVAKKEQELGLAPGSLNSEFGNSIGTDIRASFDSILGTDYMVDNMPTLVSDMKNEMKMGRTYEEAFNVIMARELKGNKLYINKKAEEQAKKDLEMKKLKLSVTPKSGSGTGTSNSDYGEYIATYGEGSNALSKDDWNSMSIEQKTTHILKKEQEMKDKNIQSGNIDALDTEYGEIVSSITGGELSKNDKNTNLKKIANNMALRGIEQDKIVGYMQSKGLISGDVEYKNGKIINYKGSNTTIIDFNKK